MKVTIRMCFEKGITKCQEKILEDYMKFRVNESLDQLGFKNFSKIKVPKN